VIIFHANGYPPCFLLPYTSLIQVAVNPHQPMQKREQMVAKGQEMLTGGEQEMVNGTLVLLHLAVILTLHTNPTFLRQTCQSNFYTILGHVYGLHTVAQCENLFLQN